MGNNNGLTKRRMLAGLDTLCVHNGQQHNPSYTWLFLETVFYTYYPFISLQCEGSYQNAIFDKLHAEAKWVGPSKQHRSDTQDLCLGG